MEEKFNDFELNLKWFSGYITEPNIQYFEGGSCKTTFSIPLKNNKEYEPLWLNCIAWGKDAEKISELEKGTYLIVGGKFEKHDYNGKEYLNFKIIVYK